jgi:hypothetical protein
MSTTFLWTVPFTEYFPPNGLIKAAHWNCTATDGTYTSFAYSVCNFTSTNQTIPYANVSEQNVLDWCWENGVDKTSIEASLQTQIDLLKNPVSAFGTPWVIG